MHQLCAGGLVFGSNPLEEGAGSDAFEIRIDAVDSHYAGALKVGVTTVQVMLCYKTEKPGKTGFSEENQAFKTDYPDFRRKMGNLNKKIRFFGASGRQFHPNSRGGIRVFEEPWIFCFEYPFFLRKTG